MPTWIAVFIPKDKLAKTLIYAVLIFLAFLLMIFSAPIIFFKYIPLGQSPMQFAYYKNAAGNIQSEFGLSIWWQDVVALDAVLLSQDFSQSSPGRAYQTAKYFVREEQELVQKPCTRTVTVKDKKGKTITRTETVDCSYYKTVYYERSLDEVISLLVSKGLLSEEQREDVKRYTQFDLTAMLPELGGGGPIGPIAPGSYLWPVPNIFTKTSNFGPRIDPVTGEIDSFHAGVDIGAPKGHDVIAAKSGTVTWAKDKGAAGNAIIIQHGNDETRYYHLSKIDVDPGMMVQAGEKIGEVGSTGRSTGPHLHFEVRINGEPVDPMQFF